MSKFKHGTKEYWHEWYWNKGGREKVQYSRKVTQRLFWAENQKKHKEKELKGNGIQSQDKE